MAIARVSQQEQEARQFYLNWLDNYLRRKGIEDNDVWEALRKEQWLIRRPVWLPASKQTHHLMRWVKKWLLRTEEWLTPTSIRHWMWVRR
jgi:hypothetical protein